jgi:hypothetical protein
MRSSERKTHSRQFARSRDGMQRLDPPVEVEVATQDPARSFSRALVGELKHVVRHALT